MQNGIAQQYACFWLHIVATAALARPHRMNQSECMLCSNLQPTRVADTRDLPVCDVVLQLVHCGCLVGQR